MDAGAGRVTIGFIGLGNMGSAMVGHLLDAGHALRVHARRATAMQPFVARGATACASPAEAARGAGFVFTNVTATADVEQVLFGPGGVVVGAAAGTVVIDHGTISAAATRDFAARLAERGIEMLDCPVSGGVAAARAAALSIMAGGNAEALARARPLLERLGRTITHCGGHGAGQVVKACNQLVQVVSIQGIAEALLLARAQGVDPHTAVGAMSAGFAGSRMLDLMGPKMAGRDFAAGIEARLHHKDYGIIADMAREADLALPAAALVAQQLNALMGHGWGMDDTSSLLKVLEAACGRAD
jgi:3-hydroxyisobutyrate dehydrogenase-like beta-hydroxyacid dehydrogenase